MMISENRKKWIIDNLHKTKLSEFPSFEFEDDSGKYPKWMDEMTDDEDEWFINFIDSLSEQELLNMMAKN
ncbi:hypothetical protein [Companilactobacillus sp. HBUAS59699]|uniref:hypothetical protein n=1 Tax=Companilactobacillus sp. HBUAS59699 TaxID=3109358 RepID=UPI002FF33034